MPCSIHEVLIAEPRLIIQDLFSVKLRNVLVTTGMSLIKGHMS